MSIIYSGFSTGQALKFTAKNATQLNSMTFVKDVKGGVLISAKDAKGNSIKLVVPNYFLAAA